MATIDSEAAAVLNIIPESGTTTAALAEMAKLDPARVEEAVQRLLALGLCWTQGEMIGITPFAHKARNMFNIV